MTGLVLLLAAVVSFALYPSNPRLSGGRDIDEYRMLGRVAIVQVVAWAVVSLAMIAGLVAWAVLR